MQYRTDYSQPIVFGTVAFLGLDEMPPFQSIAALIPKPEKVACIALREYDHNNP